MRKVLLAIFFPLMNWIGNLVVAEQKATGYTPERYFFLLSRLMPTAAVELFVLREAAGRKEILLTRRPATDPFWPSEWHFPGTVVRNGDSPDDTRRRLEREISVTIPSLKPVAFRISNHERGWTAHIFHVWNVDATFTPVEGTFFPIDSLPKDTMAFQKALITDVARGV